ncbi:serine threonine protein kinase CMGC group [Sporothrix bragantina]|uniref:Serine threonine protein kinase CMGC group n=1 Tax=Sporothrix bragantina TaxID=671064 RepID=A0ABP0D2G2_9PEZI
MEGNKSQPLRRKRRRTSPSARGERMHHQANLDITIKRSRQQTPPPVEALMVTNCHTQHQSTVSTIFGEHAHRRELSVGPFDAYQPPPLPPARAGLVDVKSIAPHSTSSTGDDGYYDVVLGTALTERYQIMKLLGKGTYGKVVQAKDQFENKLVAIKILRSIKKYRVAAQTELRVLETLKANDTNNRYRCIHMRDCFELNGHICIVMDLFGKSIFDYLGNGFVPFSGNQILSFARQLFTSVAFLHNLRLIHTDLKPENILIDHAQSRVDLDPEIRLIDFGSACFEDEYHPPVISTVYYRAPEIILGLGWHLAEQIVSPASKYFKDRQLNYPDEYTTLESPLFVSNIKKLDDLIQGSSSFHSQFLDLLKQIFIYDPSQRITATDALNHPWFEHHQIKNGAVHVEQTVSARSSFHGRENPLHHAPVPPPLDYRGQPYYPQESPQPNPHGQSRGPVPAQQPHGHTHVPPPQQVIIDRYKASASIAQSWPPISERMEAARQLPQHSTQHNQQCGISYYPTTEASIEPRGAVDIHPVTVQRYVNSYMENIQNLHPLIIPRKLDIMVMDFRNSVSQGSNSLVDRAGSSVDTHHKPSSHATKKVFKRKRGSGVGSGDGVCEPSETTRFDQLPYCTESALVLMVLALGKICLHRRGSSTDATKTHGAGDILGADYFRAAYDMFRGLQEEPPRLEHVWVLILGSLYHDQVGQPLESFKLVYQAGSHLRHILQPDLMRYKHMREAADMELECKARCPATRVSDNEKLVAAWTCLLIEGNILTELQLRPSNLLCEEQLPYPDGLVWHDQGFQQNVIEAFAWQMHMYVLANDIRRDPTGETEHAVVKTSIDALRSHTSPNPAFKDNVLFNRDLPATNILAAHQRFVYWSAELLVYRRYIQIILEFNHEKKQREKGAGIASTAKVVTLFDLEMAQCGVHALLQCISAFHDLPDQKFVTTNMYGTAHP